MASSVATRLPTNQWAALNAMSRMTRYESHRARDICKKYGPDQNDLLALEDHGFIEARLSGGRVALAANGDQADVEIHITGLGARWVAGNQENAALTAAFEAGKRGVTLLQVEQAGGSQDAVAWLRERNFVEITTPGGGADVNPALLTGHGRMPDTWRIKATAAGRHLINP